MNGHGQDQVLSSKRGFEMILCNDLFLKFKNNILFNLILKDQENSQLTNLLEDLINKVKPNS